MTGSKSDAGFSGPRAAASPLPLMTPAPGTVAPAPGPVAPVPPRIVCAGCGREAAADDPFPIRCRFAVDGDDIDHVMTPVVEHADVQLPGSDADPDPFVRYRAIFHGYRRAIAAGWPDERYVELVRDVERSVERVDGRSFVVTPFARAADLGARLGFNERGGVWVKDETANVSGSHKARHLMGVMLEILVAEELGQIERGLPLAIASCGNAALAGAVVARAAGRRLDVFVPTEADPVVLARLNALGAHVVTCEREPGVAGDPTYHALKKAIADGAIPFTCQGNENGLVIEGCETLGLEIVSALRRLDAELDAVVVQVGGAALASAVAHAFDHALAGGAIARRPRLFTVQTLGAWPLRRAFDRIVAAIEAGATVDEALVWATHHRSAVMWPWEEEPHSIAHGILDDETYDWAATVRAMLETGGRPVVVDEDTLRQANDLAFHTTGIPVDHTGSSGLAGLVALRASGEIEPDDNVAVLFTGVRREIEAPLSV